MVLNQIINIREFSDIWLTLLYLIRSDKNLSKSECIVIIGYSDTRYLLLNVKTNEVNFYLYVKCAESKWYFDLIDYVTVIHLEVPEIDNDSETALVTESMAPLN